MLRFAAGTKDLFGSPKRSEPVYLVPMALSMGVKSPGLKANHQSTSKAEVKNG